jgi:hypothetical protein
MATPLKIPIDTGGQLPIDKATVAATGVQMQMPFRIGVTETSLWLLPLEPFVSARMSNVITRRTIAKMKQGTNGSQSAFGSVKELWTKDDYEIIITGMLNDHTQPDQLPSEVISKLNGLISLGRPLIVECALLTALGVSQIVVQGCEFPATPGIGDQFFTIKAYSDNNFNLLIEK